MRRLCSIPANLKWKDLVERRHSAADAVGERQSSSASRPTSRSSVKSCGLPGKPEAEMEELFRKEREKEEALFRSEKYAGKSRSVRRREL